MRLTGEGCDGESLAAPGRACASGAAARQERCVTEQANREVFSADRRRLIGGRCGPIDGGIAASRDNRGHDAFATAHRPLAGQFRPVVDAAAVARGDHRRLPPARAGSACRRCSSRPACRSRRREAAHGAGDAAGRRPARAQERRRPRRAGAGAAAGVLAVVAGRRGADVPGRGAAAHPRRGHARRADPRQDRPTATGARTWAGAPSLFVNAATWGLLVTGKLVATHSEAGLSSALTRADRQGRRAADPQGRRPGDAHDGRAVRHRRDHRARRWQRARAARREGFRYSYDMLGEAALTAADAQRYLRRLRAGDPRHRQGLGRARHLRGPGHLDQALGAAPALQPRAARARDGRAATRALLRAGAAGASATTSASTSTPRRPTGSSSRSTCSSALCVRARARRLERHRLRGPGLPEALPVRDRLPGRPGAAQPAAG